MRSRIAAVEAEHDGLRKEGDEKARNLAKLISELRTKLAQAEADSSHHELEAALAAAESVLAAYGAFAAAVTAVPDTQRLSPLLAAALRELLHKPRKAREPATYVLYVSLSSAGGDVVTKSGAVFSEAESVFIGAVQTTYILADAVGTVLSAGSSGHYAGKVYEYGNEQLRDVRLDTT
jgi:hypothetical protein